jgi:predicted ATPase/class 3 adenylate cyclase
MASQLPTGTVTFLFTDVEGSTRLLHELGEEAYAKALAEHRRLLRAAFSRHGGVEVDTQGDAFFYAFPQAQGALAGAQEGLEALSQGPIRVRIGLHTGTPLVGEEGYVGQDVHFAARVAAAGHGGQILLSKETSLLLDGASLTSLGSHRLKDVSEPVTIYQLGERAFPALKTIASSNLPTPASSFLGREDQLHEADLLLQGTRLLTVIGPGGQGKTRFALELATRARDERFSDYQDGIYSAFLSSLRDPELVAVTICVSLGVREQPGQGAQDALVSHFEGKQVLLLLDNLEHLPQAFPQLSELLSQCPGLTLLCTSRELLRLRGERPYALPPLPEEASVSLFCERSGLEASKAIADLCSRLEGLPLAIELAAARTSVLSPEQIATRLSQRLDLLQGGRDAEARQQTLRATIAWSYDLLSEEEKALFAGLSVFGGGCTLEAAEEVCDAGLDTLQSLVDKSLVRFTDERYWMLETIREFASGKLDADPGAEVLRAAHAHFYVALAGREDAGPLQSLGPAAIERFHAEHTNVREAVSWARAAKDYDTLLTLVAVLWMAWITRGHGAESLEWAAAALDHTSGLSEGREAALAAGSEIARWTGDEARAVAWKEELLALASEHGLHEPWRRPIVLADLCDMALVNGDVNGGRRYAEQSFEAAEGDPAAEARARSSLGEVALMEGDLDTAYSLFDATAAAFDGRHEFNHAASIEALGEVERRRGDHERAAERFTDALVKFGELGDQASVAECLEGLAHCERALGNEARARRLALLCNNLRNAAAGVPWRPDRALEIPGDGAQTVVDATIDEAVEYALSGSDRERT